MCIVAKEHQIGRFNLKVEPTVYAVVGFDTITQFFGVASVELCHSHCSNGILYIDGHGMAQGYVLYALDGRNEVERDVAVVYLHVLGMEVTFVEGVLVNLHARFHIGFQCQSLLNNQCATLLNERGVMAKALHIGFFGAIDVEVVGVGRGDNAHPWTQPMERTVELVGLDNHILALGT